MWLLSLLWSQYMSYNLRVCHDTSEKQLKANRENSRKSTGPKSSKGKAIVSTNAIRHGLLSNIMVIRDKTMEEFEGFSQALIKSLQPKGALAHLGVARLFN